MTPTPIHTSRPTSRASAATATLAVSTVAVAVVLPTLLLGELFMNASADAGALAGPLALVALCVGVGGGVLSRLVLGVGLLRGTVAATLVGAAPPLVTGAVAALLMTPDLAAAPGRVLLLAVLSGLAVVGARAGRDLLAD